MEYVHNCVGAGRDQMIQIFMEPPSIFPGN